MVLFGCAVLVVLLDDGERRVGQGIPVGIYFHLGHYHLAFLVDDIDEAYEELTARGVRFSDVPQHFENGLGAIYFWDPDGVALEFIQASE